MSGLKPVEHRMHDVLDKLAQHAANLSSDYGAHAQLNFVHDAAADLGSLLTEAKEYDQQAAKTSPPAAPQLTGDGRDFHFVTGGSFALDVPEVTPSVWGEGSQVIWAEGESMMISAGNGLGKTTLAGQLMLGRIGLGPSLLGLPITPGKGRVLLLAMDRPAQARRALNRLFTEEHRDVLDDRLRVHRGPPMADMAVDTGLLADMCDAAEADTVIVDSLKDAALGLSDDKVGSAWNRSRQAALEAGVQVLELHHSTKRNSAGGAPDSIADVFGSAWLTAGCGSVVGLGGNPGDVIVSWKHLKQPAEPVGIGWKVAHDHQTGRSTVWHQIDLLAMAAHAALTATSVARQATGSEKPSDAEKEHWRRRLAKLADSGHLVKKGSGQGVSYTLAPPAMTLVGA